ncbi:MAG: FAD-dependent oxidoreductase [Proteobacteria bacterium]|nr:FAD-dependent oxidoreductase [Pseudomonadota bacterium]
MRLSCDVLVAGGGVAGIAAALRAAREGARTILAEMNSFPGGTAINCMHRYICGLYSSGHVEPDGTLNGGIADEICTELKKLVPGTKPVKMGKVHLFPFATGNLIKTLRLLSEKQARLDLLYETKVVSVKVQNGRIRNVFARSNTGEIEISTQAVIDCSGEGAVIRLSGASSHISPPEERQLAGFCFKITGIEEPGDMAPVSVPYYISQAVIEKKVPDYLKYTKFYQGDTESEGYCLISIPPGDSPERIREAKKYAAAVHGILADSIDSFRNSSITEMSSGIAEREGLRMKGEYMLTEEDVLSGRKFHDGVVKSAWPIELWDREKGPTYRYLEPGAWYQIPLRCLKSPDIKNLYCAGRCISASPEALGSTRVMGTCISLGEQAGLAAAKEMIVP